MTRVILLVLSLGAGLQGQPFGASVLVRNADGANEALAGVAKFDNCTGFVIQPSAATSASAPAYLMTAGHCIDQGVTTVVRDRALTNKTAIFRYFIDTAPRQVRIAAREAVYSTMKGTDLAIVRLDASLADLRGQGIQPFILARDAAAPGDPVRSAGIPTDSIDEAERFLRMSECTLGPSAEVVEGRWHWWSLLRNDCSDVRGGSSGSPLLSRRTGEVVGVLTTTNAGAAFTTGDFRCALSQPCEIIRGGFAYRPDSIYAAPVAGLVQCFDGEGRFRLGEGCPLDDGRQLALTSLPVAVQPGSAWNANVTGTAWPQFRYKIVVEGEGDCRDAAGYSAPIAVDSGFRITDAVGTRTGRQHLCVVGTDGAISQSPRFATSVHLRVDDAPPTIRPFYLIRDDERAVTIQPIFTLPELVRYRYKLVAAGDAGCADPAGYREYLRVPVRIPADTVERFCLIGYDEAENPTPPTDLPLRGVNLFAGGAVNAASFGAVAPGSLLTAYGSNLGNAPVTLIDGAGVIHALEVSYRDSLQINARVPLSAVPGPSVVSVEGARVSLAITELAPALFSRAGTGGGEGVYELEEKRVLWLAGTGFGRLLNAEARLSGVRLPATVVRVEGIDWVRVELPTGFPLRGWVPVQIRVDVTLSNTVWVRLP